MAPLDFFSPKMITKRNRGCSTVLRAGGVIGVVEPDRPRLAGRL